MQTRKKPKRKLFPAHAGVILSLHFGTLGIITFPRPRGGDPISCKAKSNKTTFSPPTRG